MREKGIVRGSKMGGSDHRGFVGNGEGWAGCSEGQEAVGA